MQFVKGNLFDANAEAIVNTVNTVGVMGKGVALQFKQRFPDNFRLYQNACKRGEVETGRMFITATNSLLHPKWIINFPTKSHWMNKSSYQFIADGLDDLKKQIIALEITSIALPPLGAGQGGLDWLTVKQLIVEKLADLNTHILVFEPTTLLKIDEGTKTPKLTKPRAMLLSTAAEYRKLGYEITLVEIQKMAYFLQRLGQSDLNLNYKKYYYGPYAHNLQHLLHELENGYILSEKSIPDSQPLDPFYLNPQAMPEVVAFIQLHCSDIEKKRLDNLFNLMSGYESPFGLELLSTVDWIMHSEGLKDANEEQVKAKIKAWSKRKDDSFSLDHIRNAMVRLNAFTSELGYNLRIA